MLTALFEAAAQIGPAVLDAIPRTPCTAALARDRIRKQLIDTLSRRSRQGLIKTGRYREILTASEPNDRRKLPSTGQCAHGSCGELRSLVDG